MKLMAWRAKLNASMPVPTAADKLWWKEASKLSRRRHLSMWIPWFGGMFLGETVLRHWAAFRHGGWMIEVPAAMAFATVSAIVGWWWMSAIELRSRLPGKRVRDALLAEADEDSLNAPSLSADQRRTE